MPVGNQRVVCRIRCAPVALWEADKAAMLALPPVPPMVGWRHQVRLPRDHYVHADGNDYSVDQTAVGRKVDVLADLATVIVTGAGRVLAQHQRCWARYHSVADRAHHAAALAPAAQARQAHPSPVPDVVEQRDLAVYDTAFELTDGQVA